MPSRSLVVRVTLTNHRRLLGRSPPRDITNFERNLAQGHGRNESTSLLVTPGHFHVGFVRFLNRTNILDCCSPDDLGPSPHLHQPERNFSLFHEDSPYPETFR